MRMDLNLPSKVCNTTTMNTQSNKTIGSFIFSQDAPPHNSVTTRTTLFSPLLSNHHTDQETCSSCKQQTKEQTSDNDESQAGLTNEAVAGTGNESSGTQSDSRDTHHVPESSREIETDTECGAKTGELDESRDTDRLMERGGTQSLRYVTALVLRLLAM